MDKENSHPKEIDNYSLDAIVVLGSSLAMDGHDNWHYPKTPSNPLEYVNGGNLKVDSLPIAYQRKLAPIFLLTGGIEDNLRGQNVSRAVKMAEIALGRYDMPPEAFEIIGKRGTTWGNVLDTVDFLESHPETLQRKRLGILTNAYHMPRAMRFFRRHPFFSGIKLKVLPAETLLIRDNPIELGRVINLYKSDQMARQIGIERQGVKDLESGTYNFRED